MFRFFAFLFCLPLFSQNNTISVIDKDSNKPLSEVKVFVNGVEIGKTNLQGKIGLDAVNDPVSFVKEEYYDIEIEKITNNAVVKLKKITSILLQEVQVTKTSPEIVLDSVYHKIKIGKGYVIPNYFQFKNLSTIETDTLSYIDEIVNFKYGKGFYLRKTANIIKNFTVSNGTTYYKKDAREIVFNLDYNHTNLPYFSNELQMITKYHNLFNYTIHRGDGVYKITFEPKKNQKEYPYQGYILVDFEDYGIYEMEFSIPTNKKYTRNLMYKDKVIDFKIIQEKGFLKNSKNIDGKYNLIQYSFESNLDVLNGDFKNKKFINKCYKEPAPSINSNDFQKFSLFTYSFEIE